MKMGACLRWESGGAWMRGFVVVATALLTGIAADRAQAGEATEAMRATIGEVLRILADKDLKQPSKANERRQLLEKAVGSGLITKKCPAGRWARHGRISLRRTSRNSSHSSRRCS